MKPKMTRESIEKIFSGMTDLLVKKNEDYKGASFDLGMTGNFVHIWDKVMRLRRNFDNPQEKPNFESVEDTYRDLIGYCVIGLHIIESEKKGNDLERLSQLDSEGVIEFTRDIMDEFPLYPYDVVRDVIECSIRRLESWRAK